MNVAMRLLEKKKELPKKEKFLKKSLLEAQKNLTDAYAGLDSVQELRQMPPEASAAAHLQRSLRQSRI